MVLAARWLKIPVVTMYDYEFTETNIFNRFSEKVLVPTGIPDTTLDEIGLVPAKRRKYVGVKEELYIRSVIAEGDFRERFCKENDVSANSILAVLRPPATTANYHSEKSEELLDDVLHLLLHAENVVTIIVPRTKEQSAELRTRIAKLRDSTGKVVVLDRAVDGLQLAAASDLLISGGGTMNREAALLGVPVYSIFAGRQGALDRQMEGEGLITFIRDARDLSKICLERRSATKPPALTDRVERFVIKGIDEFL